MIHSGVRKFSNMNIEGLRANLKDAIDTFLKGHIYQNLTPEKKGNLVARLYDDLPVYPAYVLAEDELWCIPYHFRHDCRPIPVFVLKDKERIKDRKLYQDLKEVKSNKLSKGIQLE